MRRGKDSGSRTEYDIAGEARAIVECLERLNALASTTSRGWVAYQCAEAILQLTAVSAGEGGAGQRFYAFPDQTETLAAIGALVTSLGDGTNAELNPVVLDSIDRLQASMYDRMVNYLNNCDNGGKK